MSKNQPPPPSPCDNIILPPLNASAYFRCTQYNTLTAYLVFLGLQVVSLFPIAEPKHIVMNIVSITR